MIYPLIPSAKAQFDSMDARRRAVREAREIRRNFTESEIDKILKDTFPASDPPAWY